MDGQPEIVPELEPAGTEPDRNVGWEEAKGPLEALGCGLGCLGCSGSALALAAVVVATVVALLLL